MTEIQNEELLEFFKALSDPNRLKIVGLLARHPHNVQQLAEDLGLSVSTVSHHLQYLAHAGLVAARADGHYYIYSLQTDVLRGMAQHLLTQENLPHLSDEVEGDAFERKVMATFVDREGRITAFPAQEKKFLVLLRYALKAFEPGVQYTEKQVNEILLRFNEDTAILRRALVDFKLMGREGGGGKYWRAGE
jgi:predicted transcriptional regulator